MSKIGRNDPCPCGSGKKFKKCCLSKPATEEEVPELVMGDAASMRMTRLLLGMDESEFLRAYKGPALSIERSISAVLPDDCLLDRRKSEKTLLLWKEKLEEEIKKLCSSHSKYYWLFLSRRIFPETTEEYDRPTTPYLHRATFNLAILKYGNHDQSGEFVTVPASADARDYVFTEEPYTGETVNHEAIPTVEIESVNQVKGLRSPTRLPRQITQADAIQVYQIEYLSLDYYRTTAGLRRLWKGGRLRVHEGRFAEVVLPKRVEELVDLYDDRQYRYGRLLSEFGSIASLEQGGGKERLDDFVIFVPVPNIEKHRVPLVFPGEEFLDGKIRGPIYFEPEPCNFVPVAVSLRPFYEKMCMFRQAIQRVFHFSPEEIVAFLIGLSRQSEYFWLHNLHARQQFFQRGYTVLVVKEDFQERVVDLFAAAYRHLFGDISAETASSSVAKMIHWLTYKESDFERIRVWDRTGVRLLLPIQGGLLVDYSAIPAVLVSIFSELSLLAQTDGAVGQIRGDDFENEVEEYLKTNIPDFRLWMCHRKVQFFSGLERDIDVSFFLGDVLFVVECKAFSVPPAFDRGEPAALKARKDKIEAALDQVDKLCELLCEERKGKNFELPEDVTHLVSIVASPFPEYTDTRSDSYFVTPTIPRVCTPEEIVEFAGQFQLANYVYKPFVWETS